MWASGFGWGPTPLHMQHLESKTVVGLLILLACIIGLALLGKLTTEAVEGLKWIGGTYMGVRGIANAFENLGPKPPA